MSEDARTPARGPMRRVFVVLVLVVAAGGAWILLGSLDGVDGPHRLPRTQSVYRNTALDVGYIGREACAECHKEAHRTYRRTTHSRAFDTVDPKREPPGGTYRHPASGLNYRIYRKAGKLRVAEDLPMGDGSREVLADHAMQFVAGSGQNSRSYVLSLDGFLVEAPITWYTKRKRWAMSPGYDFPDHASFSRPITAGCVFCHVGRVERIGRSTHRLRIHEDAIGCERCHGPGALHAEKWRGGGGASGEPDFTIVNPLDLEPSAQLDLCGQCHLDHTLSVPVRGRRMEDWRPGLPMNEFRSTYRLERPSTRMAVVGHVDQLRKSRCFQASGTMSCITCHDPHDVPGPSERKAYYRARCLSCHGEDACGIGHGDPRRKVAQDDCVGCHMPRSETDIPHFSFVHHRIGIHEDSKGVVDASRVHRLVPSSAVSHLPAADRDRSLGLAYLLLANRRPDDPEATTIPLSVFDEYLEEARGYLERALEGGAADADVESSLAFIYIQRSDFARAEKYAQAALDRGAKASVDARVRALDILADMIARRGRPERAMSLLRELTRLRRRAGDWGRIATLQSAMGSHADALASAKEAARIEPNRPEIRRFLAQAYKMTGDVDQAARQRRLADLLETRRRPVPR